MAEDIGAPTWTPLHAHAVLVGFGRVGYLVAARLREQKRPFIVIENQIDVVKALRADGIPALYGNAAAPGMLESAGITTARWLLIAIPHTLEAGQIIEHARQLNSKIDIAARAHSNAEALHLEQRGATHTIMGEREIAEGLADIVLAEKATAGVDQ